MGVANVVTISLSLFTLIPDKVVDFFHEAGDVFVYDCYLCRFLKLSSTESGTEVEVPFLEDKIALDVVFQRNTTEFTRAAEKRGHNVVYGHEMLVAQGAFQFKLFTGFEPPIEAMYSELKQNLEEW